MRDVRERDLRHVCPSRRRAAATRRIRAYTTRFFVGDYSGKLVLRRAKKSGENDKAPDYRLFGESRAGEIEVGATWRRSSEKGRGFPSVVIHDPALPLPISAAMFLADREVTAALVWSRASARGKSDEARQETSRRKRSKASTATEPI